MFDFFSHYNILQVPPSVVLPPLPSLNNTFHNEPQDIKKEEEVYWCNFTSNSALPASSTLLVSSQHLQMHVDHSWALRSFLIKVSFPQHVTWHWVYCLSPPLCLASINQTVTKIICPLLLCFQNYLGKGKSKLRQRSKGGQASTTDFPVK